MLKNTIFLVLFLGLISCDTSKHEPTDFEKGVSENLAKKRVQQLDSIVYDLSFEIPSKLEDSIPASLILSIWINHLEDPLVLDFMPNHDYSLSANVNGKALKLELQNEHLVISSKYLKQGNNRLQIDFIAGERSLNRNKEYLFTLLVPDRARTLFPCFDQPDLKAQYKLEVSAPTNWKVMGPAPLKQKSDKDEFVVHQFQLSQPMSTYLFSFVAGSFDTVSNGNPTFPMELFHMETDTNKVEMSVPVLFDLHEQSKDFLENYTEREFPFDKLDFAAIYSHPYGGMEHVGAIQYLQQSLFLDESATERRRLSRAKLIAHETAHMWFGDLVTMKWFDDVWMKEVFANFMADKIMNPIFTEINHDIQFLTGHYPSAFNVDRTAGANPIRQSLNNLNNAGSLYGNIIYHKAPIMMRQLEALLGEEEFRKGMVQYIAKYPYKNADWNELISILDDRTSMDLKAWSNVWVNSAGRPVFNSVITYDDNDLIESIEINQEAEDGSEKIWPQLFDISLHYTDSTYTLPVEATYASVWVPEAKGLQKPESISYNTNGMGYGLFPVSEDHRSSIPATSDEVMRAQRYINAYESCLAGHLQIENTLYLLMSGLESESNELILSLLTGYTRHLFWSYSSEDSKEYLQPMLEEILYYRMKDEKSTNITKTLFGLYESIAYRNKGLDRLYEVWNKELEFPALNLNEDDYTSLAMTLALYNHPNSEAILNQAEEALTNDNKKERFNFLKPAFSQDVPIRSQFFRSFANEKNREKERWVATACSYIHHPLRQKEAIHDLALSLELLEEIQATGDIFFPRSWLGSTIGQYSSEEAHIIAETFLQSNPEMDKMLKSKILQAIDDLVRVNQTKTLTKEL